MSNLNLLRRRAEMRRQIDATAIAIEDAALAAIAAAESACGISLDQKTRICLAERFSESVRVELDDTYHLFGSDGDQNRG
jgi:hypothetical protein